MFRSARPGQIPFLLVVVSAATLVAWNSIHLARAFRAARDRPPARQLDQAAADIAKLLADRAPTAASQGAVPETELTVRAGLACDILNRHSSTFDNLAATIPGAADRLERIDSALSAACAIRARFARPLSAADRAEADTEMQVRLTQSLAAVQSAQTRLEAGQPAPEAGATVEEPAALQGPLIGLACGLVCLLFARRPLAAVPPAIETASAPSDDQDWWEPSLEPIPPPSKEPPPPPPKVPIQSSALFFCDAFDRAPAPMVLLDSTGRVLRLNARAELAAGRSTDELRRQLYWGESAAPSHEPIGGLMLLPEEEGSAAESWTIGESQNATRFRFASEPRLFDGKFGGDTIVLPADQPVHAPPAHANGNAAAVEAAANELESELTLIGGHCEMLLEEGKPSSSGTTTADLELLREASQRAIHAVRRLLGGLALDNDYGKPRS